MMRFKNSSAWKALTIKEAKVLGVAAGDVQQAYLLEWFAEKVGKSKYKESLVFKGGFIVSSLIGIDTRSTRDIDFTWLSSEYTKVEIENIITDINKVTLDIPVDFSIAKIVESTNINGNNGFQISLKANYEKSIYDFKLDITNGSLVYPEAIKMTYKSKLQEGKEIAVLSYSVANIVAEKFETILKRGEINTRMRDYFDIYQIFKSEQCSLNNDLYDTILNVIEERNSSQQLENHKQILNDIKFSKEFNDFWKRYVEKNETAVLIKIEDLFSLLKEIGISTVEYKSIRDFRIQNRIIQIR